MKLSVNTECAERVSQSHISRRNFVAHRTGKFPNIKEMQDARQRFWLVQPAAGAVAAGAVVQQHYTALQTKLTGPGALLKWQSET